MRSSGVVVAMTSSRPAAWCSSMSGRANGWITVDSDLAASRPASCTPSARQPLANRAACLVEHHARPGLADEIEHAVHESLTRDRAVRQHARGAQRVGDDRTARTPQQRAIEIEEDRRARRRHRRRTLTRPGRRGGARRGGNGGLLLEWTGGGSGDHVRALLRGISVCLVCTGHLEPAWVICPTVVPDGYHLFPIWTCAS